MDQERKMMADRALRLEALKVAQANLAGAGANAVVKDAETFLAFLVKDDPKDAPAPVDHPF